MSKHGIDTLNRTEGPDEYSPEILVPLSNE
jgi:hypothetical protein